MSDAKESGNLQECNPLLQVGEKADDLACRWKGTDASILGR